MVDEPSKLMPQPFVRSQTTSGRWEQTDVLSYKEDGAAPFRAVTRQVLFTDPAMASEWRYFEVAADGHTTLERHDHVHAVMVHRGCGHCLVGSQIKAIGMGDLVFIPAMTWHQFRADSGDVLGFLCLVNADRDRPQLPTAQDLESLNSSPAVAAFIRS
jgi:mannose-6-phosphate isomerase-like protein (cupin superfamily)